MAHGAPADRGGDLCLHLPLDDALSRGAAMGSRSAARAAVADRARSGRQPLRQGRARGGRPARRGAVCTRHDGRGGRHQPALCTPACRHQCLAVRLVRRIASRRPAFADRPVCRARASSFAGHGQVHGAGHAGLGNLLCGDGRGFDRGVCKLLFRRMVRARQPSDAVVRRNALPG